jgi:hypothetical protein
VSLALAGAASGRSNGMEDRQVTEPTEMSPPIESSLRPIATACGIPARVSQLRFCESAEYLFDLSMETSVRSSQMQEIHLFAATRGELSPVNSLYEG